MDELARNTASFIFRQDIGAIWPSEQAMQPLPARPYNKNVSLRAMAQRFFCPGVGNEAGFCSDMCTKSGIIYGPVGFWGLENEARQDKFALELAVKRDNYFDLQEIAG